MRVACWIVAVMIGAAGPTGAALAQIRAEADPSASASVSPPGQRLHPVAADPSSAPGDSAAGCTQCGGRHAVGHGGRPSLFRRVKYFFQDHWWGYADEFEEPPIGTHVNSHADIQISNGVAAQMVLHDGDFEDETDELTLRGRRRLSRVAELVPHNFHPVLVEPSDDPNMDELRRQRVLRELKQKPFPVPDARVRVGLPPSRGVQGREAELLHANRLQNFFEGTGATTSGTKPGEGDTKGGGSQGGGGSGQADSEGKRGSTQ